MFKIVSSSAGSGKTYTLTKEYLKLVLQNDNVHYYKHILAITFTKAATREMKERILGRLELFGKGEKDPMLNDIVRELYPESVNDAEGAYVLREQKVRQRADRVFKQILHDYSDFAVMTIDSFVQRVVSAFTDELGMPFSFEVEMEAGELLLMAVERLLERTGDESFAELTDILESFYLEAGQEGKNYHSLPEALAGFANDLLNEQRYASIMQNSHLSAKDFKKIRRQLVAAVTLLGLALSAMPLVPLMAGGFQMLLNGSLVVSPLTLQNHSDACSPGAPGRPAACCSALNLPTASCISVAAATARSTSSWLSTGAPHTASRASPMNFSSVPPWRNTISTILGK
jgi:hypothetical protein